MTIFVHLTARDDALYAKRIARHWSKRPRELQSLPAPSSHWLGEEDAVLKIAASMRDGIINQLKSFKL